MAKQLFILIALLFQVAAPFACQNNPDNQSEVMSCHKAPVKKSLGLNNGSAKKGSCPVCISGVCLDRPVIVESKSEQISDLLFTISPFSVRTFVDLSLWEVGNRLADNGPPDQFKIALAKDKNFQAVYQVFLN